MKFYQCESCKKFIVSKDALVCEGWKEVIPGSTDARMGMKGIAFSAFFEGQEAASKHFDKAYEYIVKNDLFAHNEIYNVNIPDEPIGIRMTYQGSVYYSDEFVPAPEAGENMYRQVGEQVFDEEPNDLNRDTVAIHAGYISVTPLMGSRTNMSVYEKFKTE